MFEQKVLDKGFVRLLNIASATNKDRFTMYSIGFSPEDGVEGFRTDHKPFTAIDTDPALVARTSFAKGLQEHTKEQDEALVEYLIRNQHTSPLEMTTIWLEIKAPIFVVRQFDTVRTRSKNEVSGRYVTLPDDWYIPEVVRGKHSGGNKQGSKDNLSKHQQEALQALHIETCTSSYVRYLKALELGECPEQARGHLTVFHYTQFVWKQDLHNLMHFLSLRLDEHAQLETRQYAQAIYDLLKVHLPKSMEWFDEYRRKLDAEELQLLQTLIRKSEEDYEVAITSKEAALLKKLAKRNGVKV